MTAPTHTAIIDNGISACTCRRWNGPTRSNDETYGEFTHRAYDAHKAHSADANHQPEQTPGGLFATQQELFS